MKSIDDYKKIVITLKKKVKQLQQENIDLKKVSSQKVYVYSDRFTAIKQLKKAAKKLGLTPEMFFRAADTKSMEIVTTKRLGDIFKTMAKLHDNYVQELLKVFDVEDSGSITKDEYYQTLEMYQINEEYGSNYNRNSYSKFIYFLKKEQYDGIIGFIKMDPNKLGYITREMFVAFTQSLNNWQQYLTLREIYSAYQYMDISENEQISREEYLQAFDKLPAIPKVGQIQEQKINILRKVLLIKGVKLSSFVLELMLSIQQPELGVTIEVFYNVTKKYLDQKETLALFKLMDHQEKGSIDYDEIMSFYYMTMSYGDSFEILFTVLARKLQAMNISIERYLKQEQIYAETQLTFEQFNLIANDLFNTPNYEISEKLFQALDLDNSGIVSAQEIITYTNESLKEYNLLLRQKTKTQSTLMFEDFDSTQIEIANLDVDEQLLFELKKYKTSFSDKDRFEKFQYILTNEISCLIICLQIVQNIKLNKQKYWEDPEFGSSQTDPYGSNAIYRVENLPIQGWPDAKDICWQRISEICSDWVFMDENGANANDVIQSHYLGDCWLISALTIIASNDKYLVDENDISKGLYPKLFHFFKKYGIIVIKFNKMFRDIYVIIDDRFCTYNNKLLFAECRSEREWWVQIIEKAYAKLHSCYEALTSGDISQALFDFTGIPCTRYIIDNNYNDYDNDKTIQERKEQLLKIFQIAKQSNSLMGCSAHGTGQVLLNGEETGLYKGHAYSILHYFQLKDDQSRIHKLIMLRNPWGFGEWKLKWSDYSIQMSENLDSIKSYFDNEIQRCNQQGVEPPDQYTQGEDGIFIMNFKSFYNIFNTLFYSVNLDDKWSVMRIYDSFNKEHIGTPTLNERSQALYPYRNPKYTIRINHPFPNKRIYITLSQRDGRLDRLAKYPYETKLVKIIMCLFQLQQHETELTKYDSSKKVLDSKLLSSRRDIDMEIFSVQNATYVLIPSAHQPNITGDYVISIYFDFPPNGIIIESNTEQQFLLQPKIFTSLMQNPTLFKLFNQL
ncbi:unnamed protein product [Paramecium sonneborni]|uniref:Uncharacterized protein n=1 Tax=Paramecium sonneborni TaxID=65129 RepID=A0A8S1R6B6_9CILI|nr:unnamed protein product [Paramecium sonneborni]